MVIIAIEGSIGAGKTSMLGTLKRMGYMVIPEPTLAWAHWLNGNGDRAFFQCIVLAWYLAVWPDTLPRDCPGVIIERSPFTSKCVFTDGLVDLGNLQKVYNQLYERAMSKCSVDCYVFMSTTPSQCLNRIRRRQNPGDDAGTIDYLRELDKRHWEAVRQLKLRGNAAFMF